MRSYRRVLIPNASYFFTINLQDRRSNLLLHRIDALRAAFKTVQMRHPFYLDAIVILPDHYHMIMTLPEGDMNYSIRISLIKSAFSRQIDLGEKISQSRKNKRERGIWQRRYWEHVITNSKDYEHHVNYIHFNPVKHGYVVTPSDWRYSSIHRFISQGILKKDWACNDVFGQLRLGE
ncbi:Transposase and inactivated derivatives [Legionella steigerwaltii]|uniref:Transposase IS200 like protein n=1 Tax=Legionella steigerwaltii TaxID=460 RepID=A0A378LIE9_9GAMM|nr:transposase [Legionella steigerwaltii]KTD70400.1 Transposase IS200 like protein [Legionella steigerwaltii]STY23881.1 Transposase and inactivated derivatives [Legionella steigerwaltii]